MDSLASQSTSSKNRDSAEADDQVKSEAERWFRDLYARQPERDELFTTVSGEPIKPLYTPADIEGKDFEEEIGYPGEYPFLRGVYPSMYRGRLWTMRQFAGFGTAEETNERFHYLIDHGQTGLSDSVRYAFLDGPRLRSPAVSR